MAMHLFMVSQMLQIQQLVHSQSATYIYVQQDILIFISTFYIYFQGRHRHPW